MHHRPGLKRRLSLVLALGFCGLAGSPAIAMSPMFSPSIAVSEGDVTDLGEEIRSIDSQASVNRYGHVAFVGNFETGSDVLVKLKDGEIRNVSRSVSRGRIVNYDFAQINNQNVLVARELWSGNSAIVWMNLNDPGNVHVVADTRRTWFSQVTLPVLADGDEGQPPFIGFLGREADLYFKYWVSESGAPNDFSVVSQLTGTTLSHFRSYVGHANDRRFVLEYGTNPDHRLVVAWSDPEDLGLWESEVLARSGSPSGGDRRKRGRETEQGGPFFQSRLAPAWEPMAATAANTSGSFTVLGGNHVIAGEGIYLSVNAGNPDGFPSTPFKILGLDDIITYNHLGDEIRFQRFDFDVPVLVLHQALGPVGSLAGDCITIVFAAEPTEASRWNPADGNRRLTFSDQKGVWLLRVWVEALAQDPATLDFVPGEAIPVVQMGELLWNGTYVSQLSPVDLSLPNVGRLAGPGDSELITLIDTSTTPGTVTYTLLQTGVYDSDGDGLMDRWESVGIDLNWDGIVELDLPAMGANPLRQDLFLEIDWLNRRTYGVPEPWSNRPAPGVTQSLAQMFANAPLLNPDGSSGITLHVDAGFGYDDAGFPLSQNMGTDIRLLDGGDEINWGTGPDNHLDVVYFGLPGEVRLQGPGFYDLQTYDLHSIKDVFFGSRDKWAREFAFRYCVLADFVDVMVDGAGDILQLPVSSASTETLTCNEANFPTIPQTGDDLENYAVKIVDGYGQGQLRLIKSNTATRLTLYERWDETPNSTSVFVILSGEVGEAEGMIKPDPALNTRPGNDFVVALAPYGVGANELLGGPGNHFRTIAHMLGRSLGLRPGGSSLNGWQPPATYLSLMNYNHLFDVTSSVASYGLFSGTPPVNDWPSIDLSFYDSHRYIGNSFEHPPGGAPGRTGEPILRPPAPQPPGDRTPPTIVITEPDGSTGIVYGPGSFFQVTVSASDDVALSKIIIVYDVNGDGLYAGDVQETKAIQLDPPVTDRVFSATFTDVSGPLQVRPVIAFAYDTSDNRGVYGIPTIAGGVLPDEQTLLDTNGVFPAQGDGSGGATRQTATHSNIAVPGSGILTFTVNSTPTVPAVIPPAWREGPNVNAIRFNEMEVSLRSTGTPPEIDPAVYTSTWQAPIGGGTLEVDVLGPATYDAGGEFQAHPATGYDLKVSFVPMDFTPPEVEFTDVGPGGFVGLGQDLVVEMTVTDDYAVGEVWVEFDINGDGDTNDLNELMEATAMRAPNYRATFASVAGGSEIRMVKTTATDTSGHDTIRTYYVEVREPDTTAPSVVISDPGPTATFRFSDTIEVEVYAGDNVKLTDVEVRFDRDGDGDTDDADEAVPGNPQVTPGTFTAAFTDLSGPVGPREIYAMARDSSGNEGAVSIAVTLAGIEFPEETLLHLEGRFEKGRGRLSREWGPVQVPYPGNIRIVTTGTPPYRHPDQNLPREDSKCNRITFEGEDHRLNVQWTDRGVDPSVATVSWEAPYAGSLSGLLEGTAYWNIWGEMYIGADQDYTMEVIFQRVDEVAPEIEVQNPPRGSDVPIGSDLVVDIAADDDIQLASVIASFDVDGDGETNGPGENVVAVEVGRGVYRATFTNISGLPGARRVEVVSTDAVFNKTRSWITYGIGGAGGGEQLLDTQNGTIAGRGWGAPREIVAYGPLTIPRAGRVTFRVVASPNVRQEVQNLTRYDSMVETISFEGQTINLDPRSNPYGSDPAIAESVWDSPGPGQLSYELLGPMVYNSWGERDGHATQHYSIEVTFRPGPMVTQVNPGTGSIGGGDSVKILGSGFGPNAVVLFGEVPGKDVARLNGTELTCTTPPGIPGPVDIRVLNNDDEGQKWNYGMPYSLFGELENGFTYLDPAGTPIMRGSEMLLTTAKGYFPGVGSDDPQGQADYPLELPAEGGWLHFETWAFVPIINPIPGPFEDPTDLWYHNETSAARSFVSGTGSSRGLTVASTDMSFPFGPVISESRRKIPVGEGGTGSFRIRGPAKWNALWRQFGEYVMLGAPAQNYSTAVWFSTTDATFTQPTNAATWFGGVPRKVTWDHVGDDSDANIYYSTNGGSTWGVIGNIASLAAQSFTWTPANPQEPKTDCRLKLTWPSGEVTSPRFTVLPTTVASVGIVSGWNLISLPLEPVNPAVDHVLNDAITRQTLAEDPPRDSQREVVYLGRVWQWGADGRPLFQSVDELHALQGYWIYSLTDATVTLRGTTPPENVDLAIGWNLFGTAAAMALPRDVAVPGGTWGWVRGIAAYAGVPTGVRNALLPGLAYWIYSPEATTLPISR